MKKKRLNRRDHDTVNIAAAFLFNAAVLLFCMLLFVPRALNNDDSIIHAITAGAYGRMSAVTVHTNIIFALLLRLLQFLFAGVNWFAVFEVFSVYTAFSLTGSLLLLRNPGWIGRALAFFSGVVIAPTFYIGIHNTKLTPVIAVAGFASLFYGICRKKNLFSVLGWVILLISSFLRFNAFLIGVAFAGGIGLILLFRTAGRKKDGARSEETPDAGLRRTEKIQFWWKRKRKLVVNFVILFGVIFSFVGIDAIFVGRTPGGTEYREYNRARGAVSDFALPEYYENLEKYRALGISENDYKLIEEWNFADLEKFDERTLQTIAEMRRSKDILELLSSFFSELILSFTNPFFLVALALTAFCLVFSDRAGRVIVLWGLCAFLLSLFYMCVIGRTTHWVLSSLYGSLSVVALAAMTTGEKKVGSVLQKIVIPVVLAGLSLILAPILYIGEGGSYREGFNTAAGEIYTVLGEEHADNLYLFDHETHPANEIHRIIPTFSAIPEGYFQNSYSLGGWDTASPAKNSILERYGVEGSPFRALVEKENVFLVDTKNYKEKLTYIRENYDENATMSLYDIVGGYYVFAFFSGSFDGDEIEPNEEWKIVETALSADEVLPDFSYVGVAVEGRIEMPEAAYINLLPSSGGAAQSYRGRMIGRDGGVSVVASVSLLDMADPASYDVEVIFKTASGFRATTRVPLVWS